MRTVLRKCSIVICFFMMCPRRSNLTAASTIQKLLPDKNKNVPVKHLEPEFSPESIKTILKDKIEKTKGEPGFDLTEKEIAKFKIWPQGVIPYYIDVYSYSDKVLRDRIREFLNTVSIITSLNFLELPSPPKENDSRWVFFINRRGLLGCADHSTSNFTSKGVQKVILGYDCMSSGAELAEAVLAIAGVPRQHNSPDRNEYIRIVEENIMPDKKHLFVELNDNEWLFHDLEYDFASSGHYHSHRYSKNGQATIELQEKYQDKSIGESKIFSETDILKIKMLYNFVSKKKQNTSECHKLFEPGSNFNRYQPYDLAILPRKKPNKYTGLSNDTTGYIDKGALPVPQISEEENSKHEYIDTYKESQDIISNLKESSDEDQTTRKPIVLKNQLSLKRDPLSYLSDYKTSDEAKKEKVKFKDGHLSFGKPGTISSNVKKTTKKLYEE